MRKKIRFAILAVAVLGILAAAIFAVYRASQHVPEFYTAELAVPVETQEKASDLMLQQASKLQNDLSRRGQWQQVIKAETINGWLAVDLPRNHPTLLPSGMHDPRVHIGPDPEGITIACQVERGGFRGVISLQVSASVESAEVIALRIHKARLGAIPWSLDRVLKGISDVAQKSNVLIRWRQAEGDPVALITLTPAGDQKQVIHIDTIRLDEGQLVVAGTTEVAK